MKKGFMKKAVGAAVSLTLTGALLAAAETAAVLLRKVMGARHPPEAHLLPPQKAAEKNTRSR